MNIPTHNTETRSGGEVDNNLNRAAGLPKVRYAFDKALDCIKAPFMRRDLQATLTVVDELRAQVKVLFQHNATPQLSDADEQRILECVKAAKDAAEDAVTAHDEASEALDEIESQLESARTDMKDCELLADKAREAFIDALGLAKQLGADVSQFE